MPVGLWAQWLSHLKLQQAVPLSSGTGCLYKSHVLTLSFMFLFACGGEVHQSDHRRVSGLFWVQILLLLLWSAADRWVTSLLYAGLAWCIVRGTENWVQSNLYKYVLVRVSCLLDPAQSSLRWGKASVILTCGYGCGGIFLIADRWVSYNYAFCQLDTNLDILGRSRLTCGHFLNH